VQTLASSSYLKINLRAFDHELTPPDEPGVPVPLQRAWVQVLLHWQDQARHDALLGVAAEHQGFQWLAGRYRARAGDAIADRQLDRVRRAVLAVMLATASKHDERSGPNPVMTLLIALAAIVLLSIGGAAYMKVVHQAAVPTPATGPVAEPST
jgi:hypothetical protein